MDLNKVINLIEKGNVRGLSRAISIVENRSEGGEELLNYAFKKAHENSLVIGITGMAGAGKSTLIDKLIKLYRQKGKTVGVISIDPSSPFTGGAFLGDRIRMVDHNTDPGVYIRSLACRRYIGGISGVAKYVLYLYKAFNFDIIIFETLGTGQDETEISKYVDISAVLLVPGLGDMIQMAKAGIMEIADIFIINKCDKPEVNVLKQQLSSQLSMLSGDERPLVVNTIASQGVGIEGLVTAMEELKISKANHKADKLKTRLIAEIESETLSFIKSQIQNQVEIMTEQVMAGTLTPFQASQKIIALLNYRK